MIPKKYNSFRLIEHCTAVATATGTAGWEALFREKPVLMFGHFFYQYAPGVFRIHKKEECKSAIEKIISKKNKPNLDEILLYLKTLDDVTIRGNYHSTYQKASMIPEKESFDNLFQELRLKLISMGILKK